MTGIYCITHSASGRQYVGSAKNVEQRWKQHRYELAMTSRHHSRHLKRAWDKYGADAFAWSVIEVCEDATLLVREQYWLDTLQPVFNSCKIAGSRKGCPQSAETIEKVRRVHLGRKCSAETRARMSAATREQMADPEQRRRISETLRGHTFSSESREKIAASLRGRPIPPEVIEKRRVSMRAAWIRRREKFGPCGVPKRIVRP